MNLLSMSKRCWNYWNDRTKGRADCKSALQNLRDGLALSYAAANIGNSRAATRAREAAYTEDISDLQKDLVPKLLGMASEKVQDSKTTNTEITSADWSKVKNLIGEDIYKKKDDISEVLS